MVASTSAASPARAAEPQPDAPRVCIEGLDEVLRERDVASIEALFDVAALVARLRAAGVTVTGTALTDAAKRLVSTAATSLAAELAAGGPVRLLAVVGDEGGTICRLRRLVPKGGVVYLELLRVDRPGRSPALVDLRNVETDQWVSEVFVEMMGAFAGPRAVLDGFVDALRAKRPRLQRWLDFTGALGRREWQQALDAYELLEPGDRARRSVRHGRLLAIRELGRTDLLRQAERELGEVTPPASRALVAIDGDFEAARWDQVLAHVDVVEARIGRDPWLDLFRARVAEARGRPDEADALLRRAADEDPSLLRDALTQRLEVAAEAGRFARVADVLEVLASELGLSYPGLEEVPAFARFVASPEYARWMTLRGRTPLPAEVSRTTLTDARRGFRTSVRTSTPRPSGPVEPAQPGFLDRVTYPSSAGRLTAYLTPDPRSRDPAAAYETSRLPDPRPAGHTRYPAVIYVRDAHVPKRHVDEGAELDTTLFAHLRDAGLVVFVPTFRGEGSNPGVRELFYGEVDDLLAARAFLAKQPWVDPARIYLVGLGRGATIALLAAASTDAFPATFAFSPDADVGYTMAYSPYADAPVPRLSAEESRLRSVVHFAGAFRTPVFAFDAADDPESRLLLRAVRRAEAARAPFTAFTLPGGLGGDVAAAMVPLVARKLVAHGTGAPITIDAGEVTITWSLAKQGL
ncbi:prolyl oligopeptidase family serine peptidase [Myxococcota bacterium]|nr:prolyl oligopeptidase family serine peptidase [Myxococcota bacterium]